MQFDVTTFGQFIPYLFGTGGVAVAIFERRKNKAITKGVEADAESKEIDNGTKVINIYKEALEDLPKQYEKKYQEITALWEIKVKMLQEEIELLETSYQRKNKLLEAEIRLKNKFILSLKRELKEKDNENERLLKQLKNVESSSTK
ncbi:hypothetical protein [Tenacibaculum maritimum]|nr:hypothetical protein [Tenacibaculum maritimum]CAA0253542.1 conserved hypothetical protein [Tenacibaculum maritimum]